MTPLFLILATAPQCAPDVVFCAAQSDYNARITAALEPDPTPALGWKAMQTAAARVQAQFLPCRTGGDLICVPVQGEASADAILALPGPTDADLDRDALARPMVQALMKALEQYRLADAGFVSIQSARDRADAALAKIGEAK